MNSTLQQEAYQALNAVRDEPISAWEAVYEKETDPHKREWMKIAIRVRRSQLEGQTSG